MMHKLRWDVSHPLVRGLRRGVGCHHGGLPHKYRVAVELLFRTGDLGAVFATTTLAMGIHAPARSVVILKDTTFLNGTSLRQMAGRAGRRGFDDLGNGVFLGVSYHRIKSLFNSLVPTMRGSFPLSVSLVYRMKLLEQWNTEKNYANISQSLSQMMKQPLLGGGQNASLQHFSEFAALLLKRELGVLNDKGEGVWLGGIAANLSWMDPFNLILLFFFKEGIFSSITNVSDLLKVLACILNPIPVHDRVRTYYRPMSSIMFGAVPDIVREGIMKFNGRVVDLFLNFKDFPDTCSSLSLSGTRIGGNDRFHSRFRLKNVPSAVCLFAQTSGVSNEEILKNPLLLVSAVRGDIFMDHSTLPLVVVRREYNCFLEDFFRMDVPSADHISRDNRVKDAWQHIQDFSLNVRLIATALRKMETKSEH